ncbi:MAG: GAF domain-containing protein [Fimbriimonadaceae bacterium]|nr:GAF domain-containing protein [Fimbriimonadaceae bacterium]
MVELLCRLLGAWFLAGLSYAYEVPPFEGAWKTLLFFGAYSIFGYLLERRKFKNAGVAGIFAVADAFCIAHLLGVAGYLDQAGFLVLAPLVYAAAKYGSLPTAMAPLCAGSLLLMDNIFRNAKAPTPMLLVQVIGVMAVGVMANHRRIIVTTTRQLIQEEIQPLAGIEPEAYMELRESFRKLRDLYRDLEFKSRRDRLSMQLFEASLGEGENFFRNLSAQIQETTGAESANIYTLAQFANHLVVQASAGEVPATLQDASLNVNLKQAPSSILADAEEALSAISEENRSTFANVLLRDSGRVIGMLTLRHSNAAQLDEARVIGSEIEAITVRLIKDEQERQVVRRRVKQAELLYDISITAAGAETANSLGARVLREMAPMFDVDHLGISWLDGEEAILAAQHGKPARVLDIMSFAGGPGLAGWLNTEAPELILFDTGDDARCSSKEALKMRIGSFALIPISFDDKPYGYLTAATHRVGGVDIKEVESLRMIAAEMGQALARLLQLESGATGMATPGEFQRIVAASGNGCMVYLQPLKVEQMIETFGKPMFENALRTYARRLRAKLPIGGAACRRAEGDFVVFLRDVDDKAARSWANEVAAMASFIGITLPDHKTRVPLAMRSKVALIGSVAATTDESEQLIA